MKTRSLTTLIALVAVAGLAACGSSGSSAPKAQADGTYKKADIAKKADEICKTAKDGAKNIPQPANAADPNNVADYLTKLLPISTKQATDLAALKPAADAAADWAPFVAKEQETVAFFQGILAKAKAKDPSGQKDLAKGPVLQGQLNDLATKLGATGCVTK